MFCLEDEDEETEEYYNSSTELGEAFKNKTLPQDIAEEIKKIEAADFIIFQVLILFDFTTATKYWTHNSFDDDTLAIVIAVDLGINSYIEINRGGSRISHF